MLTESGWRAVSDDRSSTYRTTQLYVKAMMDAAQRMSPQQVSLHRASFVDHNKVVLHVLKVEYHRMCTVAYCLQENPNTGGVRFMAYGIETNADCEYGIGVSLKCIDVKSSLQYCPPEVKARYLEA